MTDCDDVSTRQATNTWDSTSVLSPLIYSVRHARVPAPSLSLPHLSLPPSLLVPPYFPFPSSLASYSLSRHDVLTRRLFALPLTTSYRATDRALDPLTVLPVWLPAGGIWGDTLIPGWEDVSRLSASFFSSVASVARPFGPLSNLRDVPVCLPDTVVIEMLAGNLRI